MRLSINRQLFLLKLCSACVFFGRAYEHIFFDPPYRSILWDEALFSPIIEGLFNLDWSFYVTNISFDSNIQLGIKVIGVCYFFCGLISILINDRNYKFYKYFIGAGAGSLIFLAVLQAKSNFYHLPMFLEHSIQFGSPIALLICLKREERKYMLTFFLKTIIALTFLSHGLYAVGWPYPLPGHFVTMTMNILSCTENFAKTFLFIAGCLDFLVALFIFLPKSTRWALIYATIWGLLTAFARIVSGITYDFTQGIFHQYLFTTVFRLPHGLIPLIVFLIINNEKIRLWPSKQNLPNFY